MEVVVQPAEPGAALIEEEKKEEEPAGKEAELQKSGGKLRKELQTNY
jgi:hypothetical protein